MISDSASADSGPALFGAGEAAWTGVAEGGVRDVVTLLDLFMAVDITSQKSSTGVILSDDLILMQTGEIRHMSDQLGAVAGIWWTKIAEGIAR